MAIRGWPKNICFRNPENAAQLGRRINDLGGQSQEGFWNRKAVSSRRLWLIGNQDGGVRHRAPGQKAEARHPPAHARKRLQ